MDVILTLILIAAMALAGGLLLFGGPDQVAVAGTLLGGLLTAVLLERVRRRHEDTHRFEQERRAVYVRLLEAEAKAERVIRDRYIQASILRERPDLAAKIKVPGRTDLDWVRRAVDEIHLLAPMWVYMSAYMVQMDLESMDEAALADDEKWHEHVRRSLSPRRVPEASQGRSRDTHRSDDPVGGAPLASQEEDWADKADEEAGLH